MLMTQALGGASFWLGPVVARVLTVPGARRRPAPVALADGPLEISIPDDPALTLMPSNSR